MRGGPLRHRVSLQNPMTARSASGDPVPTFEEFASVRADIQAESGNERYDGDQIRADVTTRIYIRWRSDLMPLLTPKTRIVHGSTFYNVVEVLPDDHRHQWIKIRAKSGVNRG